MGRSPCCTKEDGMKRGAWTALEDKILTDYITSHGEGKWRSIPRQAGLKRCGKSCRLRWLNYLRPDIKRGNITADEEDLIVRLHRLLGNRWSLIAGRLPGRTDNEVKNYWNSYLSKRVRGEHKNAKKPKILIPRQEQEESHQMPLTPAAACQPPSLPLPPLPLPGDPIVNLGCAMDGDAVNNLPVLEYESSHATSSPSISRGDLSPLLVSGISDIFEPEFSSFDEFSFGQFDSVIEGNWGSLEGVEGADISCFGSMDYAALSYKQDQWIM